MIRFSLCPFTCSLSSTKVPRSGEMALPDVNLKNKKKLHVRTQMGSISYQTYAPSGWAGKFMPFFHLRLLHSFLFGSSVCDICSSRLSLNPYTMSLNQRVFGTFAFRQSFACHTCLSLTIFGKKMEIKKEKAHTK